MLTKEFGRHAGRCDGWRGWVFLTKAGEEVAEKGKCPGQLATDVVVAGAAAGPVASDARACADLKPNGRRRTEKPEPESASTAQAAPKMKEYRARRRQFRRFDKEALEELSTEQLEGGFSYLVTRLLWTQRLDLDRMAKLAIAADDVADVLRKLQQSQPAVYKP